ncbi:MAG: hypothetical protein WCA39_02555, partial [Nitrososphaeraceae archaeon]
FLIFPTKSKVSNAANVNIQLVKAMTYKDLKKRVSLELSQQSNSLRNYTINHFGFGILSSTNNKT